MGFWIGDFVFGHNNIVPFLFLVPLQHEGYVCACVCVRMWSVFFVFAGGVFVVLGRLCTWFFMVIN